MIRAKVPRAEAPFIQIGRTSGRPTLSLILVKAPSTDRSTPYLGGCRNHVYYVPGKYIINQEDYTEKLNKAVWPIWARSKVRPIH